MGKQITYYMERESFLALAQAALDEGLLILKNDYTEKPQEPCADLSVIDDCTEYYFYLPELAPLVQEQFKYNGSFYVPAYSYPMGLALIEAGYSKKADSIKESRIYVQTGVYNGGKWVARSEKMTKIYNKLVRKVKKLAPYGELVFYGEDGEELPSGKKEYLSPVCREWRREGCELEYIVRWRNMDAQKK
ncbi:MAG: hypothetical protein IJW21_04075 [Clostridia bacterium]|nr:hypothetical protein [Clostridia bacterium]